MLGCTALGLSLHSRAVPAPLPLHAGCSALLTCSSRLPNTCPQVKQHIRSGTSETPWTFSSLLVAAGFSGRRRNGCAQAAPLAAPQGDGTPGSLLSHPKSSVAVEGAWGDIKQSPFTLPPGSSYSQAPGWPPKLYWGQSSFVAAWGWRT